VNNQDKNNFNNISKLHRNARMTGKTGQRLLTAPGLVWRIR